MSSKNSYWLGFGVISAATLCLIVLVYFTGGEDVLSTIAGYNLCLLAGLLALLAFHMEVKRPEIVDLWLTWITICSLTLNLVLEWLIRGYTYHQKYQDWLVSISIALVVGTFGAFLNILSAILFGAILCGLVGGLVKLANSSKDPLFIKGAR